MDHLDLDPRQAVFPERCLECGAKPVTAYTLEAKAGLDLLKIDFRTIVDVEVPLCASCGRRKTRGRVAWFVAVLASYFAACGVVPVAESLFPGAAGAIVPVGMALLLPAGIGGLWWARNREDRLYHRWFSPVWVVSFDKGTMIARLGFREATARRDTGVLSGILAVGEGAGEGGYRAPVAPVPAPFSPPPARPLPWWSVVVVGLGAMGGGVADYLELLGTHRRRTGLDGLLHSIGGETGALAVWLAVGLAFVALGLLVRRGQRSGRGQP